MMLFLVLLVSVRTVHLQVAVCFLFDVLPHMHSQIPRVDFTHSHTRAFLELWTVDISYSSFFGGYSHYCQWTLGKEIGIFLLQITERMVLKNENSVAVRMDCKGKVYTSGAKMMTRRKISRSKKSRYTALRVDD